MSTLRVYLARSASLNRPNPLFISFRKPHSPVSASTIARWIKSLLQDSGIDKDSFSAHSTRATSTSAAKRKGLAMADILRMAGGWSRVSTFERFFSNPPPLIIWGYYWLVFEPYIVIYSPRHEVELLISQASE